MEKNIAPKSKRASEKRKIAFEKPKQISTKQVNFVRHIGKRTKLLRDINHLLLQYMLDITDEEESRGNVVLDKDTENSIERLIKEEW